MSKRSSTRDAVPRAGPQSGSARQSPSDDTHPAVGTAGQTTVDRPALVGPEAPQHPATTLMAPLDPEREDGATSPSTHLPTGISGELPLPDETGKVPLPSDTSVMAPLDPERKGDTAPIALPKADETGKVPLPSDTSVMAPLKPDVPPRRSTKQEVPAVAPRRPSSQAIPAARPPGESGTPRRSTNQAVSAPKPADAPPRRSTNQAVPAAKMPEAPPRRPTNQAVPATELRPPVADVPTTAPIVERPPRREAPPARPSIGGETSLTLLEETTDEGALKQKREHTAPLLAGPVPKRERHVEPSIPWRAWLDEAREQWAALTPDLQVKIQVGSAALLFLLLCTIGLVVTRSVTHARHEASGTSDDDDSLLNAGRLALADKRFSDAVGLLEQAHEARPKSASVKFYLKQAQTDVAAQSALQEAKRARGEQRYPDARSALGRIPEGTDVEADRKLAVVELDGEESKYLFDRAEAQLKGGHPGAAQASVARLAELRPDLASKLDGDVKTALAASGQPAPGTTAVAGGHAGSQEDPELRSALAVFGRDPAAGADALAAVAHGSHPKSVTSQAADLAARARECATAYDATAHNSDLAALERADKACAPVNPNGGLVADIERRRVESAEAEAHAAETREDPGRAARAYRSVLAVRPSDRHAGDALKSLLAKAHELYMQGYVAAERDPDGAAHALEMSLRILAPGDADYDKARTKLAEVKGPGQR
ncbi:MAG: hypothetical protein JST54_14545 [Deltaproteobacteria bacterium]|nr:hypothetical protein [Deltaproteobacteria bacterium]